MEAYNTIENACRSIANTLNIQESESVASTAEKLSKSIEDGSELSKMNSNLILKSGISSVKLASLDKLLKELNDDYEFRRKAMLRRLDTVIQAFIWSPKAVEESAVVSNILLDIYHKRDALVHENIYVWDMLAATTDLMTAKGKVSSTFAVQSNLKSISIGHVPNRGGLPEGYTRKQIERSVIQANIALSQKDTGRWVGQGVGVDNRQTHDHQQHHQGYGGRGGGGRGRGHHQHYNDGDYKRPHTSHGHGSNAYGSQYSNQHGYQHGNQYGHQQSYTYGDYTDYNSRQGQQSHRDVYYEDRGHQRQKHRRWNN